MGGRARQSARAPVPRPAAPEEGAARSAPRLGRGSGRLSCHGRRLDAGDRRLGSGRPRDATAASDWRARRRRNDSPGRPAVWRAEGRVLRVRRCVRAAFAERGPAGRRPRGLVARLAGADDRGVQPGRRVCSRRRAPDRPRSGRDRRRLAPAVRAVRRGAPRDGRARPGAVRERFTWSSVAAQTAAVYRWVLGGGSPPSCVLLH
jgi:hypothetical protein